MYYTDTNAKSMECPLRSDKNISIKCTGSACIAWCWHHKYLNEDLVREDTPQPDWIGTCGELYRQN